MGKHGEVDFVSKPKLCRVPCLPKPSTLQGQTTGMLFTGQKGLFAMAFFLTKYLLVVGYSIPN